MYLFPHVQILIKTWKKPVTLKEKIHLVLILEMFILT